MGIENESSATNERGHFFNEKQKAVKGKIMNDCLDGLFVNIKENMHLFDPQSGLDLVFSILVMFNREVLVHLLNSYSITHDRKQIMKNLFEAVKNEVNHKIKYQVKL